MANPFLHVISAMNAANVRYVIVGGFAAFLHGSRRVTVDIDIVVDLDAVQARKAIEALIGAGFQSRLPVDPLLFADAKERERWISEKNMLVFTMFHTAHPGFVVDLFIDAPTSFESLNDGAEEVVVEGEKARICSIDDLIKMKEHAGRPQDMSDIATLRRIQSLRRP